MELPCPAQSQPSLPRVRNGEYHGMLCTVEDVAGRKTAWAALDAEEQLRQAQKMEAIGTLADLTQMHQVAINLCANAADAMGGKGGGRTLTVKLKAVRRNRCTGQGRW